MKAFEKDWRNVFEEKKMDVEDAGSNETTTLSHNMNKEKNWIILQQALWKAYTHKEICSANEMRTRKKIHACWLTRMNILFLLKSIQWKRETRRNISFTVKCERFKENWHRRPNLRTKQKRNFSNGASNRRDLFSHRHRGFPTIFNLMFRWRIHTHTKKCPEIVCIIEFSFCLLRNASIDCSNIKYELALDAQTQPSTHISI